MTNQTPRTPDNRRKDANLDPITKTPGAHPVGTGVGAAAGGVAGAAAAGALAGTAVGGPIGAAAGLVVGAVVGGLAGKAVAEQIDPTAEEAYWREAYRTEPYFDRNRSYDDYAPAYRVGYQGRVKHHGKAFEDAETDLQAAYGEQRGRSQLGWDKARDATRAAWDRADGAIGDTTLRN